MHAVLRASDDVSGKDKWLMDRPPTIRRNRGLSGPMGGIMAVAMLGIVEVAIIGILIAVPVLNGADLEMWRILLCAVLLTLTSCVFLAFSLVKKDGKLRWRWAK
jgi:hypothetical protein